LLCRVGFYRPAAISDIANPFNIAGIIISDTFNFTLFESRWNKTIKGMRKALEEVETDDELFIVIDSQSYKLQEWAIENQWRILALAFINLFALVTLMKRY